MKKSADAVFTDWLGRKIDYKEFLIDEVDEKIVDVRSIKSLIKSVDILKYFKKSGQFQFPSVAVLARIVLAILDNSGYTGKDVFSRIQCYE